MPASTDTRHAWTITCPAGIPTPDDFETRTQAARWVVWEHNCSAPAARHQLRRLEARYAAVRSASRLARP